LPIATVIRRARDARTIRNNTGEFIMRFLGQRGTVAVLLAGLSLLSGCGGSGSDGGSTGQTGTSVTSQETGTIGTATACPGSGADCTGTTILRTDQGIGVTNFGVQVYGTSTNDLLTPNPAPQIAYGLLPATGGVADVRVSKATDGRLASVTLLLSNLGLSWDGKTERPRIIETFETRQGRVQLDANGLAVLAPLPAATDRSFFDFGTKGANGTQANYANNVYFPRTEAVRCPSNNQGCPSVETQGLTARLGDWRSGGSTPDSAQVTRLHEDGATQAGYGVDANGQLVLLPWADGVGVPYPGFKGYRDFLHWSYAHANLGAWITQDTVMIDEWGGRDEHNKMRRGLIAFGQVTPAAQVPATGVVRYRGRIYGWFSYLQAQDSYPLFGEVEATVDFGNRTVVLTFSGTRIDEGLMEALPLALTASTALSSGQLANYFFGSAGNTTLNGGIGGRFFGPVGDGGSGTGPAEMGGNFQLQSTNQGPTAIGGFLLRKI
jgi:hypothetical protein